MAGPDFQIRRSRRFENALQQFLKAIWTTEDQGFLLCGNIREQEYSLPTDLLLIKLDKDGEEQWQKIIEGEGSQRVNGVVGTDDGGFLIAGETTLQTIGHDGLLLKVNAQGEEMWRKIVKKNFSTSIQSIARLSDGNHIYAVGHDDSVFGDATVTKISPDGTELWSWDIGGVDPWGRYFVKATADGGVVLLGNTRNNQTGSRWDNIDIFLVKLSTDGQEEWFWNYLKDEIYQPDDLVILSDGSFLILAGHPCGPDALYRTVDLSLLKADPQGNELWVESYNSSHLEREYGRALLRVSDDHFVIFGSAFNDISTVDAENFILQVDGNGNPK